MSYHLYQTEGIVLGGAPIGDSNRYYYLFTKELGLTIAFAQGVREVKSKLRGHLQDFSYIAVDLIRGRDTWRIVNAREKDKFGSSSLSPASLKIVARITDLLKRFLHGQEKNEKLFNYLVGGFSFLEKEKMEPETLKNLEIVLLARILYALGYWDGEGKTKTILSSELSTELLKEAGSRSKELLDEINRALKESHL
ncbi:MAG: DNA repair protein RecO [Patescibacteria group bacterium]